MSNNQENIIKLLQILDSEPENYAHYHQLGEIINLKNNTFEIIRDYLNYKKLIINNSIFFYNTGIALLNQKKLNEALNFFLYAIELTPNTGDYYQTISEVFIELGNPDKAYEFNKKALKLNQDDPHAYNNLGRIMELQNKPDDALLNYQKAVQFEPDNPYFYNNIGIILYKQRKYSEAKSHFLKAKFLEPENPEFLVNIGQISEQEEKYHEALNYYLQASRFSPEDASIYNRLGVITGKQENFTLTLDYCQKAANIEPDNSIYQYNLAVAYEKLDKYNEAIEHYRKAIKLKPDYIMANLNLSTLLLLTEKFKEGWKHFECRKYLLENQQEIKKIFWDGQALNGKTIYIHSEQGLGDTIQFYRYLPLVKEKGGNIIFICQSELINLFRENNLGFSQIEPVGKTAINNEIHVPLLSLPGIFSTTIETIPQEIPYIKTNKNLSKKYLEILGNNGKIKIGVIWKSGYPNPLFEKRSVSFDYFYLLVKKFPELVFYSLQKGPFEDEINNYPVCDNLISLSGVITDFTDTAAIIDNLDLIISVDTSVVHLAGAMGKKVWILLPFSPNWRWFLERDNSPWYPSMELIRQKEPDNWASVFVNVEEKLKNLVIG